MSSAVVSTSAALGRPFLFDAESEAEVRALPGHKKPSDGTPLITINNQQSLISSFGNRKSAIENCILPASRLEIRPAPEMVTSGIPALDALTGGLPRGCLTEIYGSASSGRTTVMLAALAAATRRGEYCSLIDASDSLDPHSLAAAGLDLDRLLWVRCGESSPQKHRGTEKTYDPRKEGPCFQGTFNFDGRRKPKTLKKSEHCLEQVLRATDLLLESGGFGLIVLDLADIPYEAARRIPLTTWFRFRRAVEHKLTILLAIEQQPTAGSCSSLQLQLKIPSSQLSLLRSKQSSASWNAENRPDLRDLKPSHSELLTELKIHAELIRSRLNRKPARSIAFETKTAWAG